MARGRERAPSRKGGSPPDWRAAWRGRHDNPLLVFWQTAAQRAEERRPWWKRSPGLLLTALLASLGLTALLVFQLAHLLSLSGNPIATRTYALTLARVGTSYLLLTAYIVTAAWLLTRVYQTAYFALGLLARDQHGKSTAGLDEAIAASPLRAEEVVLAAVAHGLRLLRPPLIFLSLLGAAMNLITWLERIQSPLLAGTSLSGPWQHGILGALAAATSGAGLHYACGMLGAALMVLFLTGLGAAPRPGLVPGTGALAWTIHTAILAAGSLLVAITDTSAVTYRFEDYIWFCAVPMLSAAVIGGGLLIVTVISAHWHDGLRQFAAYGGAFMFAYILVLVQFFLIQNAGEQAVGLMLSSALWAGQVFGLANLGHFSPGTAASESWYAWLSLAIRWPVLLALQLALLPVLAGFARRAAQLRREGER